MYIYMFWNTHHFIQMILSFHADGTHFIEFRELAAIGRDYIYLDSREPSEYNRICHKSLDQLFNFYVRAIVTVISTVLLAYAGGVYSMFVNDHGDTLFGFKVWGIEVGSDFEYCFNVALQFIFIVYFVMGNIGMQLYTLLFENVIKTDMLLIEADLRHLARDLKSKRQTAFERKERFINVFRSILRSNEWMIRFKDFKYTCRFISPLIITYSIGFCILCQYNVSDCELWPCRTI